jgi:hypothetical protein
VKLLRLFQIKAKPMNPFIAHPLASRHELRFPDLVTGISFKVGKGTAIEYSMLRRGLT